MAAMRKLVIAIVVAALAAAALWWLTRTPPLPVRLATVDTGTVEAIVANTRAGEIEACLRTRLSTIVGGRIDYLGVKEGDRVEAGQVLLRLWSEDNAARLAVNRAQLESARSRVVEVCDVADNAERDAARQRSLFEAGFVSAARVEQAESEARSRRAACASAAAEARTAEAVIAATSTDLERSVLVAPFAGTVAKITGELGEYSTPSPPGVPTPPAIDLIDDSCLYVRVPMDEIDAPRIRPGQSARIRLDAVPDKVFEGSVTRVAPYISALERQARTVDVDVAFVRQDDARGLLVGYSTDVEIVLDVRKDTLRVPTSTLLEGNRVYVYLPDSGTLALRTIETGLANWQYTETLSGLAAGERVVTSLERAGLGDGVRVVAEE